jgi:hypothetical protein
MSVFDEAGHAVMVAVLDRLVPAVDDLPAAGAMGIADDVERLVTGDDRFGGALVRFVAALPTGFATLLGDDQDRHISAIQASLPADFALVLEISYIAYYSRPEVHARIGWRTGPLQPLGFELPPFDESALDKTRQLEPFWRRT